ncbi:MAG: catalytic domain, partial [Chloroflexia bacterium]|nr:catalytic domain [Chloroflexia bacterium]
MEEMHWFDETVPILEYTRLPQESGVYAITHESLPIVYVGITQSIRKRIKDHVFYNERGEGLPGLAEAWHTYGPEVLRVAVLERGVPTVLLRERENYWLRTLAKDYQ